MRYKFCIIAATLLCRATGGNCVMKAGAVSEIFLRRCLGYKWHKAQKIFFTVTPRFFFFINWDFVSIYPWIWNIWTFGVETEEPKSFQVLNIYTYNSVSFIFIKIFCIWGINFNVPYPNCQGYWTNALPIFCHQGICHLHWTSFY